MAIPLELASPVFNHTPGKRGDAKVVGVHARPLYGEGLGDDVRGDEAKCESKCQPKNGWLRVRFSDQHELGMPAV